MTTEQTPAEFRPYVEVHLSRAWDEWVPRCRLCNWTGSYWPRRLEDAAHLEAAGHRCG